MNIDPLTAGQLNAIVWNWQWVKDFPSVLCKELLHQGEGYFAGWATIESADEFLSLQLRDQTPSKCLTGPAESHRLDQILKRMADRKWTFESLASDIPELKGVERKTEWFKGCVNLDKKFDIAKMGPFAIHPRKGSKHLAPKLDVLEIYEGQHRALVLAKKLVQKEIKLEKPLRMIYLFPDRPT